jgi:SOS-response transcriptional repressor LexA
MFQTLSDNLNLLMAKARINASELARQTGLPASTIKKIRNNDNPNPTLTTLIPLAKYFLITLSELIGEESFSEFNLKTIEEGIKYSVNQIPLLTWKDSIIWPSNDIKYSSLIMVESKYSKSCFALQVIEDDWENLPRGTILVIDPEHKITHRDLVVIHKEEQDIPTLKQIFHDEETTYLKPIVHGYNITTFTPQHKSLGVVMEYRKYIHKK